MYEELKERELSLRTYNLTIGAILLWGFAINWFMCKFCTDIFIGWNLTAVIIGYFIVAISGIFMSIKSSNPFISFIGYNLVVLPVGVVLSIALTEYEAVSIKNCFFITAIVTGIMIALACAKPDIFLSMGAVLFVCLLGVVVCEIILLLLRISTPSWWDFMVALLFCGYIGYDWAKAQKNAHTLDNAVDSCVELYLDIINLFLRLLSASDKSSKKRR